MQKQRVKNANDKKKGNNKMISAITLILLLPIIVVSYKAGYVKGFDEADQFKPVDEMDTPIYNQMALEHPDVFMFMKAKNL